VRSGIRQIGNVIIFQLGLLLWKAIAGLKWSNGILLGAFSIIRRWFRHYMWCFRQYTRCSSRLYASLSPSYIHTGCFYHYTRCIHHFNIRGGFAIIRSGSSIIRGAFNIIRDAFIQLYFHILSTDMISRLLKFGMWLTILFGFCLWSGMTMTCFNKVYLCTLWVLYMII
jgi:hypothetical protein